MITPMTSTEKRQWSLVRVIVEAWRLGREQQQAAHLDRRRELQGFRPSTFAALIGADDDVQLAADRSVFDEVRPTLSTDGPGILVDAQVLLAGTLDVSAARCR